MEPSDAELVAGRRWDALVDRHGPAILSALREFMKGSARQDAEDLAQEFWMRLLEDPARRFASFDPSRPLLPWLLASAIHHALNRLAVRKPGLSLGSVPERASVPPEDHPEVRAALSGLSPRDRLVLELAEVEGVPHERITRLVGLSPQSVSSLLGRARERLRRRLEAPAG